MKINEIFYSLQGEGSWSGLPNIFIRTTGCNLRCSYCDTKYAYNHGKKMSIKTIINEIQKYSCKFICITGGEPLLQDKMIDLIKILLKNEYFICLETNGSLDIEKLKNSKNLMISLDIKTPSSGMHKKMIFKNLSLLTKKDQLKFVIENHNDYHYSKDIINKYKPDCKIFFQPLWGTDIKNLSTWILKDNLDVRLSLQLQKIIWGDRRGL